MNRFFKIILIFFLIILNINFAYAHPGGTDSNGGHHVTATGEYHYHHGYPPHDHVNGICPYRNDNKTGINNGMTTFSSGNIKNDSGNGLVNFISDHFIISGIGLIILYSTIRNFIINVKEKQKTAIREEEKAIREKKERDIREKERVIKYNEELNYYKSLYEGKSALEIAKVPNNIIFGDDDLPISIDDSGLPWGREFTVYYTPNGNRFHTKIGCSNATRMIHAFKIIRRKPHCLKCVNSDYEIKYIESYKWYLEYVKIKNIKLKYHID